MKQWLRRFRGAIGMGLTWAFGWAVAGLLIGVASKLLPILPWNWFFDYFDAPLPALAIPGFVAGALFSIVLGIAGRRRRFDELSLPRFVAWGAVGGLMLSLVPATMVAVGLGSSEGSSHGLWEGTAALGVPFIFLSAFAAGGSLTLARRTQRRDGLAADEDAADGRLADGESQELSGDSSVRVSLAAEERAVSERADSR